MSRARKLVEGALKKLDEASAKADAAALAKMTPAERERHEYWQARAAAVNPDGTISADIEDPRLFGMVLGGPAGDIVHGVVKAPKDRSSIDDPAAWEEQRRLERAARDEIRAEYLAPDRSPVRITRVATRGKTQLREVADYLGSSGLAARPDLVYGAYRVPDFISPGSLGGEGRGIVEWDIVHAATEALSPTETPSARTLDAKDVLVVRSIGEPAPLDEDLALHVLAAAGIGPEHTLGIARDVSIAKRSTSDDTMRIEARVDGVHLLATRPVPAVGVPLDLPEGPPDGVVVDALQWDAIAVAVHPVRQHRAPLPSPFPYLPLTPQELLTAYLEIVGVSPADAYSAQVTHDRPFDLMGRTSTKRGVRRTGGGPDLPCADGKPRQRMAGGHHLVVAYRDAPAYAEGRARFDAYAEGELEVHLRRGFNLRAAVPKPTSKLMKTVDRVADVVDFFTGEMGTEDGFVPTPVLLAAAMSDVEHAGWAVGGPGSRLRRRRSPVLGAIAFVLLAGGAVAAAVGIYRLATEAGPADERILARGTVAALEGTPTAPVEIEGAGTATVWLNLGGLSNVRESIVAGTECTLERPDSGRETIRGSRQGASIATDHFKTIGEVALGAGRNLVSCRHVPFGRIRTRNRLRQEHPFVVERGSPGDGLRGLWLLIGGSAALVLGVGAGMRWRAGTLVRASSNDVS